MVKKITFLASLFCFITLPAFAQQEDDGGSLFKQRKSRFRESDFKTYKNIIKTDVFSAICGDIPFILQHKFSSKFDLEAGPGLLLPYYVDFFNLLNDEKFTNDKFGFSFLVAAKLFTTERISNTSYYKFFTKYQNYALSDFLCFGAGWGYQFIIAEKFALSIDTFISTGISMNNSTNYEKGFSIGLSLQFGYVLN